MLFLRKILKLPSAIDLGWSDDEALQSRDWTPDCDGYTWEDWHETVKKMHPVKYWIAETLGDFLRYRVWLKIKNPITDAIYWLKCHFLPSYRFHFLDLRQPSYTDDKKDCYKYGWRDVPVKMLYAWFNLLGEYIDKEEPYDLTSTYTLEEIMADPQTKRQHEDLQEAKAILHWWRVTYGQEWKNYYDIQDQWYTASKDPVQRSKGVDVKYRTVMYKIEQELEDQTDEMLMRLIKIRRSLWT